MKIVSAIIDSQQEPADGCVPLRRGPYRHRVATHHRTVCHERDRQKDDVKEARRRLAVRRRRKARLRRIGVAVVRRCKDPIRQMTHRPARVAYLARVARSSILGHQWDLPCKTLGCHHGPLRNSHPRSVIMRRMSKVVNLDNLCADRLSRPDYSMSMINWTNSTVCEVIYENGEPRTIAKRCGACDSAQSSVNEPLAGAQILPDDSQIARSNVVVCPHAAPPEWSMATYGRQCI
jgi:hypothetical protein